MNNKNLTLNEVFKEELRDPEFQRQLRLRKPYEDLIVEIINRRIDLDLTQKNLAKRANTYQSRISKIETGEHDVRFSTIIRVAEALETELDIRLVPFESKKSFDKISHNIAPDYSELVRNISDIRGSSSTSLDQSYLHQTSAVEDTV